MSQRPTLSIRYIATRSIGFVACVAIANRAIRAIDRHIVAFDRPPYWPIGVFQPRVPSLASISAAIACGLLFWLVIALLERANYRLGLTAICALALMMASNSIQGWHGGFVQPISGTPGLPAIQYYDDALKITDPLTFLADFTSVQTRLLDHARTHPPGAVLAVYALQRALGRPELISIAIGGLYVIASTIFLRGVFQLDGSHDLSSRQTTLLFLLLPAVQIYGLASVDALVAAAVAGCVYSLLRRRTALAIAGMSASLIAASFLSFAALFLPPVLAATEWRGRRSMKRSTITLFITAAVYVAIWQASGFSYLTCLSAAARLENPEGFRLFSEPASYVFTRLECVAEILVFAGPFALVYAGRGLTALRSLSPIHHTLFASAIVTLLAMFASGAFHTGETARACLFIYPFLFLPIAASSRNAPLATDERRRFAGVLFGQTVMMQLLGDYFW